MTKWSLDVDRLRALAPFGVPLAVIVLGWILLISPAASRNAATGREIDSLRQRLTLARAAAGEPAPPPVTDSPVAAFQNAVARRDVSSQLVGELAAMAGRASAVNLVIETGERVEMAGPNAPQATGVMPDPRLILFETPLAYTPVEMSFDAEFAKVGELLWGLRDLATAIEIRSLNLSRGAATATMVHAELTLFVYAQRPAGPAIGGGR